MSLYSWRDPSLLGMSLNTSRLRSNLDDVFHFSDLLTLIHANKTKCERLTSWMPVMPGELPRSILLAGTERLLTLSRYVVVLVSDSRKEKSSLNVFRAADIGGGPICKINLEKLLPMAFHCAWSSTPFQ